MNEGTRKSFYIFLSMVLGVLLFLMLQRAAFLIAFLAGADLGSIYLQALNMVTSAVAIAFGAWYGIWLGLLWYAGVYEERHLRGMFSWLVTRKNGSAKADGEWELDDLVSLAKGKGGNAVRLEYFEADTADASDQPRHVRVKPKTTTRSGVRKPATRKL